MRDQIQRLSNQSCQTLILFLLAWYVLSCTKEVTIKIDCRKLELGLINKDPNALRSEINSAAGDLIPVPSPTDPLGHADNLNVLVDRLNSHCKELTASTLCYGCVLTLPALSEIVIEVDSAGVSIDRTIDIVTPDDKVLEFRAVH